MSRRVDVRRRRRRRVRCVRQGRNEVNEKKKQFKSSDQKKKTKNKNEARLRRMWRERSSSCFGLPLRSLAATHLYSCSVMDSSAWSVEKPTCGSYFHVILFRFEKKHTHTPVVSTCFVFQCFWGPTKKGFLPFGFPRRLKMAPTPTKSGKRKNRMECAEFAMRPEPSPAVEDVLVVLEERHADRRVRRPARNHQRPALQTEHARRNLQIGVNQEVLLIFLD